MDWQIKYYCLRYVVCRFAYIVAFIGLSIGIYVLISFVYRICHVIVTVWSPIELIQQPFMVTLNE